MNYTGYRIIFQKWLSIAFEELFKDWNRWMTGESIAPPLQYNSQKLGTSLQTRELISLSGCSRGHITITCSLPGAGYNSILDEMYQKHFQNAAKFRNIHVRKLLHTDAMPALTKPTVHQPKIPLYIFSQSCDIEEIVLQFIDSTRFRAGL